jgi:NAD(P)-dependent dehydrogenase (short-subunit alcohol dehydrogenase family)
MSLLSMLKPAGPNGFGYGTTAEKVTEGLALSGKTVLITGCTAGIGEEAARVLALRGVHVLACARTKEKAQAACKAFSGKVTPLACELSDPASVRACVAEVKALGVKLDALLCNAGIMALPKLQQSHGYELQFFTNHVGHFLLVTGLLDVLAPDGRVVLISSDAHQRAPAGGIEFDNLSGERGYEPWKAYGQSKFANLLFARELQRRFAGSGCTAYAVHPGVIATKLSRSMGALVPTVLALASPFVLKDVREGAATGVFAAVHPKALELAGEFLGDCNRRKPRADALDEAKAKRLWEESEKIAAQV